MPTWMDLLGTDGEAVVGSPDPYRAVKKSLERQMDDIGSIRTSLSAVVLDPAGFEGLAASAYIEITGMVADQLDPFMEPLEASATAMGTHADELDELLRRADDALGDAVERVDRLRRLQSDVDDLRGELAVAGEDAAVVGLELQAAERRARNAEDDVELSRRAHSTLRLDEQHLNSRTADALDRNRLPEFEAVVGRLGVVFLSGISVGVPVQDPVWNLLRRSLLEAGIDISYPAPTATYEHAEGCIWTDNGVLYIEVGGPSGGSFAVGSDISPGVYSVMLHLLNGELPDFRPWDDSSELSDAESSAFWWAASTNWPNPGDSGQLQVSGINGSLSSYYEGGGWTPQRFWTINGLDLAISSTGADPGVAAGAAQAMAAVTVGAMVNGHRPSRSSCEDDSGHGAEDDNHHHS